MATIAVGPTRRAARVLHALPDVLARPVANLERIAVRQARRRAARAAAADRRPRRRPAGLDRAARLHAPVRAGGRRRDLHDAHPPAAEAGAAGVTTRARRVGVLERRAPVRRSLRHARQPRPDLHGPRRPARADRRALADRRRDHRRARRRHRGVRAGLPRAGRLDHREGSGSTANGSGTCTSVTRPSLRRAAAGRGRARSASITSWLPRGVRGTPRNRCRRARRRRAGAAAAASSCGEPSRGRRRASGAPLEERRTVRDLGGRDRADVPAAARPGPPAEAPARPRRCGRAPGRSRTTSVPAARSPSRWFSRVTRIETIADEVERGQEVDEPQDVADRAREERRPGAPPSRTTRRPFQRLPGVRPPARAPRTATS